MSARGALRWSLALAMLAVASAVTAASFGLAPIGLTIAAGELSGSIVVTNTGTEDVVIQARPYAWTQNGEELRTETRELVINPPIFKLAVGEQQLVRVASRAAALQQVERAYRVVFSEVPTGLQTEPGFHIRVAMDIPLYIEPVVRSSAQLAWRVERTVNGGRLVAENSGGRHFRLRDVRFQDGEKTIHTIPRIVVLAKSTLAIDLPEAARIAQALRLTGQDDADQSVSIDIAARSP
jgi:fimbrial chaperone protein